MLKITATQRLVSDPFIAFTTLVHDGFTPFEVINVVPDCRLHQTAIIVEIDVTQPGRKPYRLPFDFIIEDPDRWRRSIGRRAWANFCQALGFNECPEDSDELVGRRAAVRVADYGATPEFASIAGLKVGR